MFAYALGLLILLRSAQKYGPVRRVLSVVLCIVWMEACIRVWPTHLHLLRGVAILAAEADLMGSQLDGTWSIAVPFAGHALSLLTPFALTVLKPETTFTSTLPFVACIFMSSLGYTGALIVDSQDILPWAVGIECSGSIALYLILGIN